jgi:hypothetical protein
MLPQSPSDQDFARSAAADYKIGYLEAASTSCRMRDNKNTKKQETSHFEEPSAVSGKNAAANLVLPQPDN